MNKNTMKKRAKYWKIGIIFYVLMLFCGSSFLGNVLSTKATPSSHFVAADITPTSSPTPTTIPTPTTTPSPTPAPTTTPAPTPTPAPQPQQTPPPYIPPPPPPDATASPTATVTSTAVPTLPTRTNDHPGQNTPPNNPGSGSNGGTSNIVMPLLTIGTPALFLSGGLLFWFYLRRNKPGLATLQKGKMSGLATNTPWTNSRNGATSNGFVPVLGTFTGVMPYSESSPYATGPALSANAHIAPGPNMFQQSMSPSPAELAGPLYGSSDLRPMTMAFPTQVTNQQASDLIPYQLTSNMNPLLLDAFDLPQHGTKPMAPEHMPNKPVPAITPENLTPTLENSPLATPMQNTPQSADPASLSVQPPDVASDPMLENVMRQAQLGLFVIPGHEEK